MSFSHLTCKTYKSYFFCNDIMVDLVLGSVVGVVFGMGQALSCQTCVVLDKACPSHQHVQNKTNQHHTDGNDEEDDGVLPLVFDQEFGEDSAEWNDYSCSAYTEKKISIENLVFEVCSKIMTLDGKKPLTLSGHHALCVAFGKHPHVSIETGLLHWRHNRVKDCYGWKWLGTQCSEPKRMTETPNMILRKGKYE